MPRKSLAFRPDATDLETRRLPSASLTALARGAPAPFVGAMRSNALAGRYTALEGQIAADLPVRATLAGSGIVRGMGRVQFAGTASVGGFTLPGRDVSGTLTLSDDRGSVTIRLTGSAGGDYAVFGSTYRVKAEITAASGVYGGFGRTGSAELSYGRSESTREVVVDLGEGGSITDVQHEGAVTVRLGLVVPLARGATPAR